MKGFYGAVCFICLGFITLVRSAENNIITIGIPPQDEKLFQSERIKCKDGSKTFSRERLNDDFCDCADGTDEPGTSACPEGKFYCRNVGHAPLLLFSSRVNDGICDCCDGSDEYDGKVKCSNTCWEAGRVTREKLKRKLATYKEGFEIRRKEIEHAKQMIAKEKVELASLKEEEKKLKDLVDKLKATKEAIEKVEEQERLKRENEEQRIKDAEKQDKEQETLQSMESSRLDSQHISKEMPDSSEQDSDNNVDETQQEIHTERTIVETSEDSLEEKDSDNHVEEIHTESTNGEISEDSLEEKENKESDETEGLSREELGRLVASRWTGEEVDQQAKDSTSDHTEQEEHDAKLDPEESRQHDEYDDYSAEDEEAENRSDEDEEDDGSESKTDEEDEEDIEHNESSQDYLESIDTPGLSWWGKLQQGFRSILRAVKLSSVQVDMSDAAHVRKDYNDLSRKLSKMQSRISTLENKLKQDYGNEGEFYSFYDQCFEHKENKYIYKICTYKQASQVEGHSTTNLGRWDGFKDSYKIMEFSNGDRCWNGPDRSLKIRLRCGLKNEFDDVDEPSRCEYIASLLTPAFCQEERLQELQKRLDSLNQEIQTHDEL
jgi:protein kinase C substrate 80K-H